MKSSKISIVGISCRFPDAPNYDAFWSNLENSINSVKEVPKNRWDTEIYYSKNIDSPNRSVSKWCGLLDDYESFDNNFFNISNNEALQIDPQQRLLLEETWHCIENSGIPLKYLQEKTTSVYIGVMMQDYRLLVTSPDSSTEASSFLGNNESIISNRISHFYNLCGSSLSINTACSSSLVAVHEAKRSLLSFDCDYAIVGGVNLNLHPWKHISFSKSYLLSPDGQCKTFDKNANGYVPGDGIGIIILQRYEDALKDNNYIYANILGSSVNHGGKALSLTAPKVEAQKNVILGAIRDADIHPDTISYVEAHGTGTSLGDPIEIEALTRSFNEFSDKINFCKIGSVKTNIGHLEAAAGIAGLIKVVLMLKHKKIPKTLNISTINPIIDFSKTPFIVSDNLEKWNYSSKNSLLRAGISSFGAGGINSHIIIEEQKSSTIKSSNQSESEEFFFLSAKTKSSLNNLLSNWKYFAHHNLDRDVSIKDLCRTLLAGRTHFQYRYGASIKSVNDLINLLDDYHDITFLDCTDCYGLAFNDFSINKNYAFNSVHVPLLRKQIDNTFKLFSKHHSVNYSPTDKQESDLNYISFILSYALSRSLFDVGFNPEAVMGSGNGLFSCLTFCDMIDPNDIINYFKGETSLDEIPLFRPTIPFFDHSKQNFIFPSDFDISSIRSKFFSIRISNADLNSYYLHARQLYESQLTFKNYLNEWIDIFSKYGLDILAAINDPQNFNSDKNDLLKEKNIFFVAIVNSLSKLYRKWDLRKNFDFSSEGFNEILEFFNDDYIPNELLFKICFLDEKDILKDVNAFLGKENYKNLLKCPSIRRRKKKLYLSNAFNLSDLINSSKYNHNNLNLEYIHFLNLIPDCHQSIDDTFQSILINYSLQGINFDWGQIYPNNSFNKLQLPVYSFDKNDFRISNINHPSGPFKEIPENNLKENNIISTLSSINDSERQGFIFSYLTNLISDILDISATEITESTHLDDLGFDSLAALKLQTSIEEETNINIDISIFFEGHNFIKIVDLISSQLMKCLVPLTKTFDSPNINIQGESDSDWIEGEI